MLSIISILDSMHGFRKKRRCVSEHLTHPSVPAEASIPMESDEIGKSQSIRNTTCNTNFQMFLEKLKMQQLPESNVLTVFR